jgi:hypothetical protein
MRALIVVTLLSAAIAGCGSTPSSMTPASPSASSTLTGTWTGPASDSSGSMMGAGLTASMMNGATWQITQDGSNFSGSMQFPGYAWGMTSVSGMVAGHSGTFTMRMPTGSMMMMNGSCSATATGTFDMDDLMTQMHGTYVGTNTCSGPFDRGQMSMTRR